MSETAEPDRRHCPIPMLCGVEFCDCPADDLANATELLAEIPSLDGKTPPPAPTPAAVEANRMWHTLKEQKDG